MTQQDDYYYEIQLTNKQLVFYFLAGATGLVLAFLAGVMVGRGVQAPPDPMVAQPVREEKLVTEEPKPTPLPADALAYAKNLESDKTEDVLERPGATPRTTPAPTAATAPPTTAAAKPTPAPAKASPTAAPKPTPKPTAAAAPPSASASKGAFTIQVGAFRDRASAESVATRLKGKGFAAFVVSPTGEGLFNVRVGSYAERPEAERVMARLRDQEKFKPFIVKN